MSKGPETLFKEKVFADLDSLQKQGLLWVEKISQNSIRGTPDLIGCANGNFFALELKKEGAKARADEVLQNVKLEKIRKAGGMAMVVSPSNWPIAYRKITDFIFKGKKI